MPDLAAAALPSDRIWAGGAVGAGRGEGKDDGGGQKKMIRTFAFICLIFFLILSLIAGADSQAWRQKLTLTITTPTGPVTASVVQSIRWSGPSDVARAVFSAQQGSVGSFKITGEAAVIEVAPGRYLFALLRGTGGFVGNPGENLAYAMLVQRGQGGYVGTRKTVGLVRNLPVGEALPLPPEAWPMLVTFADVTDPASVLQIDHDDLDAAFGCDREPAGLVLPWRAAGLPFQVWLPDEALRRANAEASARAGISGEAAAALEETARNLRPNWGPVAEERARLEVLARAFTREQKNAWERTRDALRKELPALIPTPAATAAAWGGQCHQLTGVTVEVTKEPVTEGVVRGVLGPTFFQAWAALGQSALDRGIRDPYFQSLAGALGRETFIKDNSE